MKSNNPVFNNSAEFNGRATTQAADPSQWQIDLSGGRPGAQVPTSTGRMTLDSVIEKTAITLGMVIVFATITWFAVGSLWTDLGAVDQSAVNTAYLLAAGGAIVGFILAIVNSRNSKPIKPGFVLAYAAFEGVFVGAFSKVISAMVGEQSGALVFQAVLATFVAAGATLAAYKFFNIQVTERFRRILTISLFAFLGVVLVNFVLSLFGVIDNGGVRGFGVLGLVVSLVAIALAVACLIMDFDFVEKGINAGLPARESWRAAFGLTVTLVWLYIEILRVLAILRGDS